MSNFSAVNYALSKKLDNAILSGVVSHSVDNVNKTITFTFSNGTSSTLQFNNPTNGVDGVGIATMYKDTNNHLLVSLTDGTTIDVGELPIGNATGPLKEITNITYLDTKLTFSFSDGTNKIVTVNPKLTELSDVSISNPLSGQVLVYNGATNKFINSSISTTDQYVKMTGADSTGSYLADLIDNDTLVNNNNKLEVNKIKGQQITVDELNTLIGMNTNVKDSLNALSTGGMVFKDVVPTKADLPHGALNGYVYIVNSDESDNGNRNAYIYSDVHGDYVLVGTSGLETRNFTTNPINLESEVTGILPSSKIDTTELVNKTTDIVSSLTYPIPDSDLNKIADLNVLKQINTEVANALNSKVDKSAITSVLDNTVTDEQVATAKAVYNSVNEIILERITPIIIQREYGGEFQDEKYDISHENTITEVVRKIGEYYKAKYGNRVNLHVTITTNNNSSVFNKSLPSNGESSIITISYCPWQILTRIRIESTNLISGIKHIGALYNSSTGDVVWSRVCSTSVEDVPFTELTVNNWAKGSVVYTVKDGICYLWITGLESSTMSQNSQTIVSDLPKPKRGGLWCNIISSDCTKGGLLVSVSPDGKLQNYSGINNTTYFGTFSYPVAE